MGVDVLHFLWGEDTHQELLSSCGRPWLIGNSAVGGLDNHNWISLADSALNDIALCLTSILDAMRRTYRVGNPKSLHVGLTVRQTRGIPMACRGRLTGHGDVRQ